MKALICNITRVLFSVAVLTTIFTGTVNAQTYQQAVESQKPFMMCVFSYSCPGCTQFAPYYAARKNDLDGKMMFVNAEFEKSIPIVQEYKINSVPTVYLVNPKNGKKVLMNKDIFTTKNGFLYGLKRNLLKVK